MQGTQYATKRSILCRGAFCGPTGPICFIWDNKRVVQHVHYYSTDSPARFLFDMESLLANPCNFMII